MLKIKNTDRDQLHLYTASLMLKIASADDIVEESEINVILDILCDFYKISIYRAKELIVEAKKINDDSTDLYEVGSFINNSLSLKDKLDFISCIYGVAYADNNMHFIERHIIKQIVNILNINKDELKKIKKDLL